MIGNFTSPDQEQIVLIDLNPCLRLGDKSRSLRLPDGAIGFALEDSHDRYVWDSETLDVVDTARRFA